MYVGSADGTMLGRVVSSTLGCKVLEGCMVGRVDVGLKVGEKVGEENTVGAAVGANALGLEH